MRLHRFYISEPLEVGKIVRTENPELIHQWIKVFRFSIADRIIIFKGDGREFEGFFELLSKKEATIVVDKENKVKNSIKTELHIFQSIIKKDNFELVVEKCTEIGASAFHPIISERSEKKDLNLERLKKISIESSEQSGKVVVPEIFEPTSLETAIKDFDREMFVLDFGAENFSKVFEKFSAPSISIFIGPEGGWTDAERELFKKYNVKFVSLGSQILRAETAAIAASSLILLS